MFFRKVKAHPNPTPLVHTTLEKNFSQINLDDKKHISLQITHQDSSNQLRRAHVTQYRWGYYYKSEYRWGYFEGMLQLL